MLILIGLLFILPMLGAQLGADLNIVSQVIASSTVSVIRTILRLTGTHDGIQSLLDGYPAAGVISRELRELIHRMSRENPLWDAPRIHGELLKLGFEIAESTVSTYVLGTEGRRRRPTVPTAPRF